MNGNAYRSFQNLDLDTTMRLSFVFLSADELVMPLDSIIRSKFQFSQYFHDQMPVKPISTKALFSTNLQC